MQCYNTSLDGDSSSLITRAKYTASDANSTFALAPACYFAIDFTKGGINTGLSTLSNDFQLLASHDAISTGYLEAWLYYAVSVELSEDFLHQVSY